MLLMLLTLATLIPDPGTNTQEYIKDGLNAVAARNWTYVAAIVLIGVVAAAKAWGTKLLPFLKTGKGAWLFTVVLSSLAGLGAGLGAGTVHGFMDVVSLLLTGAFVGAGATGLYRGGQMMKKVEDPPK